jgi:toxin ParE1/3/4
VSLRISPAAERDLEEIADYIAQDNPRRALSFIAELRQTAADIKSNPLAWPERSDLLPGLRMRPFGQYLVFYRPDQNSVRIERILHASRDIGGGNV